MFIQERKNRVRTKKVGEHNGGANRPCVLGTGLIALDLVISADAGQPVRSWTGGTCGNVLTILSFLGWQSYPIARLNGDAASLKVKADMRSWGVHLDYAECTPTSDTPIIVQEISRDKNGAPKHRFSWFCPHCGNWLPSFKPVTMHEIDQIIDRMISPQVFFMDRLSRASLTLAAKAKELGALIFFEISAKPDSNLLQEALKLSHIVKYAKQRFDGLGKLDRKGSSVLLEIQTLGPNGLQYRSYLPRALTRGWKHFPALPMPRLADTCGAGDWCTAGIIAKLGVTGRKTLQQISGPKLREALTYGQALAAWTCGFEGARGGMYCGDKKSFEQQIRQILKGKSDNCVQIQKVPKKKSSSMVSCPACPTNRRRTSFRLHSVQG